MTESAGLVRAAARIFVKEDEEYVHVGNVELVIAAYLFGCLLIFSGVGVRPKAAANLEQRHPDADGLHARFKPKMSRQAAVTTLPITGEKFMRRRQQFIEPRPCYPVALQERPNFNVDFGRINGIRRTCQEASQVAEESEMFDWFSGYGILAPTGSFSVCHEQGGHFRKWVVCSALI